VTLRVSSQIPILDFAADSFHVVGDPPYPGIKGCFLNDLTRGMAFLWIQLIAWNARKCKCAFQRLSSDCKLVLLMLMLVPALRVCKHSWFDDGFNTSHVLDFRPTWRVHHPNEGVYRDGKALGSNWQRIR